MKMKKPRLHVGDTVYDLATERNAVITKRIVQDGHIVVTLDRTDSKVHNGCFRHRDRNSYEVIHHNASARAKAAAVAALEY